MNFILIILQLLTFYYPPGETCTAPVILEPSDRVDIRFSKLSLDAVFGQPNVTGLVIKVATCCNSDHGTERRDETSAPGIQHTMAFGLTNLGIELTEGIAALPCPPHCVDDYMTGFTTYTYEEYVKNYMIERIISRIEGGMYIRID